MGMDTAKLTELIREGCRRAFGELRAAHPEQTFYAFALYTDGGLMTIMPAANTEQRLAPKAASTKDAQTRAYYRWAPAEWAYEASGLEHFDEAHELLNAPDTQYQGDDDAAADRAFRERGNEVIGSMVEALRQLDAEQFFGTGDARNRVTLFVSVSDDDGALEIETKSAEVLNPPAVAAAFAKRYG